MSGDVTSTTTADPTPAADEHDPGCTCGDQFTWPPTPEDVAYTTGCLKETIAAIEHHDQDYEARYALVLIAVAMAVGAGLKAGFRIDPAEPDWPVAYIELPTGQVSWHMPAHSEAWDGHTTEEKYARIRAYVEGDDCDGTPDVVDVTLPEGDVEPGEAGDST